MTVNRNRSVQHCFSEAFCLLKSRGAADRFLVVVKHKSGSLKENRWGFFLLITIISFIIITHCMTSSYRCVWGDGEVGRWTKALDIHVSEHLAQPSTATIQVLEGSSYLSSIPNWPLWKTKEVGGLKWREHFAPFGKSPRSFLLSSLPGSESDQADAAQLVAHAWANCWYRIPEDPLWRW